MSERRVPCRKCHQPILHGAQKCKACKAWQADTPGATPKFPRAGVIMISAIATVMSVIVTTRESPVGDAPPLTKLTDDPADGTMAPAGAPAPVPAPTEVEARPTKRQYKTREILFGDIHPLDVALNPNGKSVYVSGDDATLREYRLDDGKMIHKASVPARGDSIKLLYGRYVAMLRNHPGVTQLPVMDTTKWDRDPLVLRVGRGPRDVSEMPDGESIVTATTNGGRVARFGLPSGRLLANITLPQSTGQLLTVNAEGRPYLAALGSMAYGGRPAGAWVDVFDPTETPFGATRRSIPVGRDPGVGSATEDGRAIFFPDQASNRVMLIDLANRTDLRSAPVGQKPESAFVMAGDRYGITLNSEDGTASVVELESMKVVGTLMLKGKPRAGALTPDRKTLFVSLGGPGVPPRGDGVTVISGDPPEVIDTLPTGDGAGTVSVDGTRAVVPNYFGKSITIVE